MHILITGGTGFIGNYLVNTLLGRGDTVTIVTRTPGKYSRKGVAYASWDDDLTAVMETVDAVINLAGSNLFDNRWTDSVRETILNSRIKATSRMVNAIKGAKNKPKVFISGSAVGYYGPRGADVLDESQPSGQDFLAKVCVAWEHEAKKLDEPSVRLVIARIGIVQQTNNGALQKMLIPFKLYGGGPLGHGSQYYPWVHMDDMVHALLFCIDNDEISGPVNISAPTPVTMDEFAATLGKVMDRPSWFRVPGFMLKIAVGDSASSILASLRAVPNKLLEHGYKFRHPNLERALRDMLND
jgi:uncharacterized protein (TIGR01777 family)